jgi:7-cyano-7-deazaguanine synthase
MTTPSDDSLAVLVSGGLDSAILVAECTRSNRVVHPLYVRSGFSWEETELRYLRRYLGAIACTPLASLRILEVPVADLLPQHWSTTGRGVPDAASPDEAVFLPGRNALLLTKAMLWCHLASVPSVALATLKGNPFTDATAEFFRAFQDAMNRGLGGSVRVLRPYAERAKVEVMRRGGDLPLELSFSCIRPLADQHCGACNKCAERRRAFEAAGRCDLTAYADLNVTTESTGDTEQREN